MKYKNILSDHLWANKNNILSEWLPMKSYTENPGWNRSIKYKKELMSAYQDIMYSV